MQCRKGLNIVNISNGLLFFERCSLITATVCAYKLNNARYCLIILFRRNICSKIVRYHNTESITSNHWLTRAFLKIVLDSPFDVLPLRSLRHALFCAVTYDPICLLDIALLQLQIFRVDILTGAKLVGLCIVVHL